ncbi:MAG: FAD-binding oxidoreductase [Candidatus Obscuribacterales bacterium]|nr:FAD-binding oxidoreductase [Candidatus Obscuribacterales bacterium]
MSKELETVKDYQIATQDELSKVLRDAGEHNLAIVPGIRRKLPKAIQAKQSSREFAFLNLSKMDKVLEHCLEDQVIKVETGISVNKLNDYLKKSRQWWPVSAVDDSVTVFDVINAGVGGPLDHRFGGPRQLVLGLDVALASGDISKCGGRVVKNVTGYDLTKLFVGSHATLGIPYAAYLRLYALPENEKTICWISNDAKVLVDLARNLTGSGLPLSCLELIDSHLLYDLASEDTKAIEAMGVVLHQRQAMLIARLHGHSSEVAELSREALAIGNQLKIDGQEVAGEPATSIWVKLSSPESVLNSQPLTVSATWTQISKIVEKWRSDHKFVLWQARPNMSLIKIFAQDESTMLELKESLKAFFKPHNEQLIIASSDEEFEIATEYLGQDTSCADELKKELKTKFDPLGLLNPLAAL